VIAPIDLGCVDDDLKFGLEVRSEAIEIIADFSSEPKKIVSARLRDVDQAGRCFANQSSSVMWPWLYVVRQTFGRRYVLRCEGPRWASLACLSALIWSFTDSISSCDGMRTCSDSFSLASLQDSRKTSESIPFSMCDHARGRNGPAGRNP
jgi:hypothetical protein